MAAAVAEFCQTANNYSNKKWIELVFERNQSLKARIVLIIEIHAKETTDFSERKSVVFQ